MNSNGQSSPQPKKRNQGRRKVNIEKIKNETNLRVSFSKRRTGLFKKASELCTRTGAEVGLVVFSPGNKAHSFGHPSIKTIADRFSASDSLHASVSGSHHVYQMPSEKWDIEYLAMLEKQIEVEKTRKEEFDKTPKSVDLGKLDFQQLKELRGKIIRFGENLQTQLNEALKPMPYHGTTHHSDDVIPYDHGASEADAHWPAQH